MTKNIGGDKMTESDNNVYDAAKISTIEIHYTNRPSIFISGMEIERMEKASEAIEMLNRAKEIARRFIDVSSK